MKKADLFETNTHAFVIRIWLEDNSGEDANNLWQSYITHIPSGEKLYTQNLNEILFFVISYIEGIGIKIPFNWRIARLIRRKRYRELFDRGN